MLPVSRDTLLPTGELLLTRGVNPGPKALAGLGVGLEGVVSGRVVLPHEIIRLRLTLRDPWAVSVTWDLRLVKGAPVPGRKPWLERGISRHFLRLLGTLEDVPELQADSLPAGDMTAYFEAFLWALDGSLRSRVTASFHWVVSFESSLFYLLPDPLVLMPQSDASLGAGGETGEAYAPAFPLPEERVGEAIYPSVFLPMRRPL